MRRFTSSEVKTGTCGPSTSKTTRASSYRERRTLLPTEFCALGEQLALILFPTEFGPLQGNGNSILMQVGVKAFGQGDGAVVIVQKGSFTDITGLSAELEVMSSRTATTCSYGSGRGAPSSRTCPG